MKILVVSDTHKQHKNLEYILEHIGPIDRLIHLGDAEGREDYIKALLDCPLHIVGGNCDGFVRLPSEEELYIGKYKVLICHGHQYNVNLGIGMLKEEAKERNADIVMYGHTHVPLLKIENDITILNPGSISYPRQNNPQPSFALIEVDRDGEIHFTINYV